MNLGLTGDLLLDIIREAVKARFDYGAPTGFRVAVRHPARIAAIISQNGNAYEEGLSDGWNPIRAYWREPSPAHREALRAFLTPEATFWQYTHGVPDAAAVSPDGYSLDDFYLTRPGADEIQLDLFRDYASNVALYPAFQDYFRKHRPRLLAVWGRNDPFFLPAGAEAFQHDIPEADIRFFETGHFALETHAEPIAAAIREFRRIAEAKKLDAVLDLVGNSTILDSLAMLRRGGCACLAGWLGGLAPIADFNPLLQMASGVYLTFFASFVFGTPGFPLSDVPLQQIAGDVAAGRLEAKPARVFRFDQIREAHRAMEANEAGGKMVVVHD